MDLFDIPSVPDEECCFHREKSKYSSSGQMVSIDILLANNFFGSSVSPAFGKRYEIASVIYSGIFIVVMN